jgi:hypothetical protein
MTTHLGQYQQNQQLGRFWGKARPNALMVIATDADRAGERYATQLTAMATAACVPVERAQPGDGLNDWNDVVKARAGRGQR